MATDTTSKLMAIDTASKQRGVYVPRTRMEREALAQLAYHQGKLYGVTVTRFGTYGPGEGARYEARLEVEDESFYGHAWWEDHDHQPILMARIHTGGHGRHVVIASIETIKDMTGKVVRKWNRAQRG